MGFPEMKTKVREVSRTLTAISLPRERICLQIRQRKIEKERSLSILLSHSHYANREERERDNQR